MSVHLQRQVDHLKQKLLTVGGIVEKSIVDAVNSVLYQDAELARAVIDGDDDIDQLEVEVEEECLKTLALYQPVATDLRFVVSILKINNDLERMGDLAANIAKRALFLADEDPTDFYAALRSMASKVESMVKRSLDALVNGDADLARTVREDDDAVDEQRRQIEARIKHLIRESSDRAEVWLKLGSVVKHLERLGDMATNIAEDVIYMTEGEIVRHSPE